MELLPEVRRIDLDPQVKRDSIEAWIQPTVDSVVVAYEWDFAMDEATFDGGTVLDEAQYVLEGNNDDAQEIINIKYDSDENLLQKMHPIDIDRFLDRKSYSTVSFWVPDDRVNRFPRVRLVATPDEAGKQIKYRYRKKNLTLTAIPDNYSGVIAMGVARNLVPGYEIRYDNELTKMIDNYRSTQADERVAHMDPVLKDLNQGRDRLFGWS